MARRVLFITADQWRADTAGFAGHPLVKTPHLDALAAESVVFDRHFTCSAPCGPARATMLTGLYPFTHRSVRNGIPLDARFTNLAKVMRAGGLDPVLFGYTDTSIDPRGRAPGDPAVHTYEGVLDGFRLEASAITSRVSDWIVDLAAKGYAIPERIADVHRHPGSAEEMAAFSTGPALYRAEDSDTAFTAERVIDWLRPRRGTDWFVHVSFLRPHPPLIAPAPYNDMYDPAAVAAPIRRASLAEEGAQHPFLAFWHGTADRAAYHESQVNTMRLGEDGHRAMRAVYYGLLTEVDHHVGRIVAALKDSGDYDDTLIVVTSDHGEMLGDHWLWGKGGWFDGAYHLPLLVRDPRHSAAAGRHVDAFTESVDLAPTILSWLGLTVPHMWDGRRLDALLEGREPESWRDGVFWEFDFREPVKQTAETALGLSSDQCVLNVWRDERYKYVHFAGLEPLLFDLEADPQEFDNRAGDPTMKGVVADYAGKLLDHRMIHAERTLTTTMLADEGAVTDRAPRY